MAACLCASTITNTPALALGDRNKNKRECNLQLHRSGRKSECISTGAHRRRCDSTRPPSPVGRTSVRKRVVGGRARRVEWSERARRRLRCARTMTTHAQHDRDPMELAVSNATETATPRPVHVVVTIASIQAVPYTIGIFGNLMALFILHRTRSSSNQKHGFMLRCLATNDCIALTGMLVLMFVGMYWPETKTNVWSCRFRVLWRFFGLGSGCVAIVMAVERWLALTKPFFYQKVMYP